MPYARPRTLPFRLPWVEDAPRCAVAHVHTDTKVDVATPGATTTLVKPTGIASGEIMVAAFVVTDTSTTPATYTMATGWTEGGSAGGFVQNDGFSGVRVQVFWAKDNVASMVATKGGSGTATALGVVLAAFSGVDTTTAFDVVGTGDGSTTASGSLTVSSITIATANAWDCGVFGNVDSGGATFSATGFTVSQTSTNANAGILYNTTPKSTGATGTAAFVDSPASGITAALRFALRPAGGAAAAKFRKTLHSIGTRVGSRQTHGWGGV